MLLLTSDELLALTGYKQPAAQLAELQRQGYWRARRAPDQHGGWTAQIRQCDWGHKAEKLTWLYIVGCHPDDLPPLPPSGDPTGVIKPQRGVPRDGRKIVTKAEREHTPPALAAWLVDLAERCRA